MAIANNKDLTHVVRTTQQWESSYDKYECIPEGVLCIEFTTSGQALAKIGNGRDIFSKLPYIGGADLTNYFTKEQTTECINDILKAKRYICIKGILNNKNQLPTNATCGDLYFVISDNQSSSNKYDEYVYSPNNTWEPLGSIPIDIDLSEYAKIVYVDEKIDEVNERIDDIEQHGTHTHANKDILDLITAAFTAEEKDKLSTLYNYDDTELRELITQASHTHSNKDILDAISAPFTAEDRVKLDSLTPYDDTILKEKITALERLAHEHSNKRILDRTTASFTTEYERKMRWIRIYTGCTGMEEGIAGLVPAAQAGEEDYVLSGSGEWVPQTGGGGTYELPIASTSVLGGIKVGDGLEIDANGKLSVVGGSGGGDSIAEGDGITITTDPQTGVKTISVDTGNGLQINQDGEVEIDPSIIPDIIEYNAGEAIAIRDVSQILPAGYVEVDYIEGIGNYTVINYIPNRKTKIVGTAMMIDTSYDPVVFGTRTGGSGQQFVFWFNRYDSTQAKVGFVYGTNTWSTPSDCDNGKIISYTLGDQFTFLISLDDEFNINDSFVHNITENGAPASNLKLGIFALVNSSSDEIESSNQIFRGRIYEFKIYEDDELVVNLIPAVSTSTNQSGFYDVINDIFYTSKTATPFGYDPSTIHSTGKVIDVNYGNGLTVNQDNELEVNIGDGLSVNANNEVELSKATANALGGIKVGSGFVYTSDGLLNATPAAPPFDAGDGLELIYDDIDALPNGYGHIDYVCSNPENNSINANGRARTLIDYVPTNTTKLAIKMQRDSERSDLCFIGSRMASRDHEFCFWNEYDSVTELAFSYGSTNYSNACVTYSSYITGQIIEVECVVGDTSNTLSVDGTVVKTYTKDGDASPYKLGIFQVYLNESWGHQTANGKIYYIKLYEGDTLAVNLIPAVRLVDEAVGFYDNVNDKFYTSNTEYPFTTDMSTLVIDGAHRTLNTKYSNGLILNQNNELEVNIGTGLEFDQTTGAINVTGGSGDTVEAGDGIDIDTDSQTGNKVISIDTGNGLQINQDGELEIDPSVLPSETEYRPGKAIEFEHNSSHLSLTDFSNTDFIASITRANAGTFVKAADNSTITLTASGTDCYTVGIGGDGSASGSYAYNVKANTQYRLMWDSSDTTVPGNIMVFENAGYTNVYVEDQSETSFIDFTTSSACTFITTRLGVSNAGDSVTFSNVRLYEYVEYAFEYDDISVKYDNGLTVNSNNELEVVLSKGLEFDPNATETMVADEMYLFDSRVTCQVYGYWQSSSKEYRTFTKLNPESALCCLWEVGSGGSLWTGPLFVGLTATSVQYSSDIQASVSYQNTFNYLGKTWYTSGYPDFLSDADHEDKLGHLQYLGSYSTTADQIQAAKDLIDLANVQFVSNAGIQAKLGNGLQFDANGAIEAVGGGETYDAGNGIEIAEVTHEDEFRVQNQEYFFTDHGLTCILTGNYGPRTFTKINDGDIVAAVIGTTGGWYMPLFVGLTEDSVKYSNSYDSNILGPDGSFTYHDKTWYYTANYALTAGDGVDHAGHLQSMTDTIYDGTEGKIQAAKDLIDLAVLLSDVSTPTISAKIGAGLSFDANGAIQADAQPLSPATDSTLGGVIVGDGINVDEYGEISLSAGEGLDIDFESPLPSEYTLVKGISSVGHNDSPYINTGYLIKPTSRIIVRGVLYKTTSGWRFPIGVRDGSYSNPVMFCTRHESNGDSIELWVPNDTLIASATDREKCYNAPVTIIISSDGLNIENETTGEVVTLTTSNTLPTATLPLYIFATNDNNTLSFSGPMDLYRLQIFEGSTKLYDYIPCKRNSDNKYGLYDIINDEFKLSPNNVAFSYVQGTPTALDLIQQIKLLPATENTIGGVKPGDGILVDSDGTISVDPTIIPEVTEYEAGTAISIEDVEHGGVIFDAWDSGTGWENVCYSNSIGDSVVNYPYEAHSPISNSYTLPAGATKIRAISYDQNDTMLWTSFSWIDSNNYHFASTSSEDGYYDDWFDIPTGAVKVNFGVRHSKLNTTTAMSLNDIKSVDITVQTVSEIEVDVWNGGTGWLNGNYYSGNSDTFTTSWYYSYHSNPDAYIPIPNGVTHVMVMGISNENDSHFEGGGVNVFSAESHSNHIYWWGCAWEWHEISSDAKFVQIDVKWNNNNTRTISAADIKSVTLAWKLPSLEINQAINVKYGDGLTVNQNNELEVNLGSGLQFDANGAIEVVGGGGSGGNGDYTAGDAIEFRSTQLSFNVDAIRWDISNIKSTSQTSGPWTQVRYIEFCDDTDTPYTISSASGIWEDNTSITYSTTGGSQTINDMIANTKKMCAIWRYPDHTMQLTFNLDTVVPCADIAKFRIKLGDDAPERDPKSWKVYFRDAATQIWYIVQDITNAELSNTRDVWSNYYSFDITGATSINVKYGTGLAIDPITGELFVDGQLPEGTIIKKLTYVGNGSGSSNVIKFTKKPVGILSINGSSGTNHISAIPASINSEYLHGVYGGVNTNGNSCSCRMSYNDATNELTFTQSSGGNNDPGLIYNANGKTYTMQYLVKGHAGSGTSVNNEVSVIKTISYTGTGTSTNNIQLPETPDYILGINGRDGISGDMVVFSFDPIHTTPAHQYIYTFCYNSGINTSYFVGGHGEFTFNSSTNILTLTGGDQGAACNYLDRVYYLRYVVNEVISSSIGGGTNYLPGEGIEFTELSSSVYADKVRMEITGIKSYSQSGSYAPYVQMRYLEFSDENHDEITLTSGTGIWDDGTPVEYPNPGESIDVMIAEMIANTGKMIATKFDGTKSLILTFDLSEPVLYDDLQYLRYKTGNDAPERDPISWKIYFNNTNSVNNWNLAAVVESATITNNREEWTQYFPLAVNEFNTVVISAAGGSGGGDTVAEGNGISITTDQQTGEKVISVNIGTGLAFDPQTGAINVTGGGGGSGDTVAEGDGISITTDQQTGNKVIAVNPGSGLQVNQTTNELEVSSGVVTSITPTQNTPGSITVTEGDGTTTPVSVISQMGGATSSTAGTAGYVLAPSSGDDDAYLRGDGTWDDSVLTDDDELTLVFVPDDYQPS